MNPAKDADEPTFGQGFVTGLWNNGVSIVVVVGVVAAGAALVAVTLPVAVVTAPVVVGGGVVVAAGAAAYGGYQTGLAAHQLRTGAEVNQLGVPTGRQLTSAELGEKAADVTAGVVVTGAGAAGALRGRWAAQAVAGAEAEAVIAASAGPGATRTWLSRLPWRKAPSKPGPQNHKPPAASSEPASYGGENPKPWTPPPGSSQPGGSPLSGPGGGAGAGSNEGAGPKGGIPQNASDALKTIRQTNAAPKGHKGGVTFANDGRGGGQVLPKLDSSGKPINYQEFDVSPFQKGVNRGTDRIVTGSDGKAYFTNDHYRTFIEIP